MEMCTLERKYFDVIFEFLYYDLDARILRKKSLRIVEKLCLKALNLSINLHFSPRESKVKSAACSALDCIDNSSRIGDFDGIKGAKKFWVHLDRSLIKNSPIDDHHCVPHDLGFDKASQQDECR